MSTSPEATGSRFLLGDGPQRRLLSVQEAADAVGIGRSTLYEFLRNGALRSIKIGKLRRIRPEDLDAWIEAQVEDQFET